MEEDIKILKEFLELRELHSSNSTSKSYLTIYQEAVRNLMARYKELEKENENLRDTNKKLYEMGQRQAMQILIEDDYIPKSKVKEKIEELEKEYFKMLSDGTLSLETKNINAHREDAMKTVLEELLED